MNSVIWLSLSVCFSACLINALPLDMTEENAYEYLNHFGYLPTSGANKEHGAMRGQPDASAVERALRDFQDFAGLPKTGVLDKDTKAMMKLPRCGVKDHNSKFDEFTLEGSKWPKNEITYYLSGYPDKKWKLSNAVVDDAIKRAFDVWSAITPLTFTRLNSKENVDIEIFWGARKHRDCNHPFDGASGTLAHAFFPQYGGDAHFDDDETWTVRTHKGINLFQVAVHEFGHSLGLRHSKVKSALMAPFYRGYQPNFQLHGDDINGIQAIYGGKTVNSACGLCGKFKSKSGCVTSKNFPKDYSNNENCAITIEPVEGHEMEVKFTHFDLEEHASCQYDYLEIREEGGKSSKHCGKKLPTSIATNKKLHIKFHSDGSVIASGYKLEWTSTPIAACGECGDFSSASGCVTSKNYPKNYPNDVDCAITIQPVTNQNIQLKFTHFDLEEEWEGNCAYDYIEISEQGGQSHGKFCGKKSPTTITSSKKLIIRFYSDGSVPATGFKLQWTAPGSVMTNTTTEYPGDYSGHDYTGDYSGHDYTGDSGHDYTGDSGHDYTGDSGHDYTGDTGNDYTGDRWL